MAVAVELVPQVLEMDVTLEDATATEERKSEHSWRTSRFEHPFCTTLLGYKSSTVCT